MTFESELIEWRNKHLSAFCFHKCKHSCCDCTGEGSVQIDDGYLDLFNKDVPIKEEGSKGPHIFKSSVTGKYHFTGGLCPNYDALTKKCLIHNQYPRCAMYPLVKVGDEYMLFSTCELHDLDINCDPLRSLIMIFDKYDVKLFLE